MDSKYPSTSLANRLLGLSAANAAQRAIMLANQLAVIPFFLSAWGTAYFGDWIVLTTVPSMIAFSDIGIGSATSATFVLRYLKQDFAGATRALIAGMIFTGSVSVIVIAALCVGLAVAVPCGAFASISIPTGEAVFALIVLCCSTLCGLFASLFDGIYRADRRAAFGIYLVNAKLTLRLTFTILVLMLSGRAVQLALAYMVLEVLWLAVIWRQLSKRTPLLPWRNFGDWRVEIREVVQKGIAYALAPARRSIVIQGYVYTVRAMLGAEAVVVFSTLKTVFNSVTQLMAMINQTIYPEMQASMALGEKQNVRKLYQLGISLGLLFGGAAVLLLAMFGADLYSIWTGGKLAPPRGVWLIMLAAGFVNVIWYTSNVVFRAANRPEVSTVYSIVSSILCLLVAIPLIQFAGLFGAFVSILVFELSMMVYIVPISAKHVGQDLAKIPQSVCQTYQGLIASCFRWAARRT